MKEPVSTDVPSTERVVEVINPGGAGGFVLVCEHASHFIPPELANLGVVDEALESHIAWDPGAAAVARRLSEALDATLVVPCVSRLVYDCNRPPEVQSAMAVESEIYAIPGNVGLTAAEREARVHRFYLPFRVTLAATIENKCQAGNEPALVTVHSFTPVYKGTSREMDLGILHDADTRLADALVDSLASEGTLRVRRNAPYGPQDGVTYTLTQHALPLGLLNAMIEIRNDLIADADGQRDMALRLARHLESARAALAPG